MSTINFAAATKNHRVSQLVTDLGSAAYLLIYSGTQPASPDLTVSPGNLLCALPCSATWGTVTYAVQSATVNAVGSGGTNGAVTITGSSGTGTKFQATGSISGGALSGALTITVAGSYSVAPTFVGEAVTGGSLTGATVNLAVTALVTAGGITQTNASGTGTATWARFATSNTAGAAGIIDLDCGTSNASVILNTVSIVAGGPIVVSSAVIQEA